MPNVQIQITGMDKLESALNTESKKHKNETVVVGYTANYAVFVHENLEARHNNGQAKFLEQPAKTLPLGKIIHEVIKKGGTILQGLLTAGMRLQRESQKLVPVDTGNLKASAFTRKE